MMYLALAVLVLSFAAVFLGRRLLARRELIAAGIGFVVIGLVPVAYLEWRYSLSNTMPATMAVPLDRAVTVKTAPFRIAITGPYELWLVFDHGDNSGDFDCWTGSPGMEARCPRADPALGIVWTAREDGEAIADGATDWSQWHRTQAALDPAAAARERKRFLDIQAKATDPANRWPLYYSLGDFEGMAGHTYLVQLAVQRPAGPLAALHPRLVIGLSSSVTNGLGTAVMVFALLCVAAGAVIVLIALRREVPK